jgi:hypothetical protein
LAVGEAVVPAPAAKPGIPRGLTGFHAPKEAIKGMLEAVEHILEHLGMDTQEMLPGLFEAW